MRLASNRSLNKNTLFGLAAAMGIGRFAFTPLMPLMQEHAGLTLAQGGWLAAANYAGYLAGALLCVSPIGIPVPPRVRDLPVSRSSPSRWA